MDKLHWTSTDAATQAIFHIHYALPSPTVTVNSPFHTTFLSISIQQVPLKQNNQIYIPWISIVMSMDSTATRKSFFQFKMHSSISPTPYLYQEQKSMETPSSTGHSQYYIILGIGILLTI